jgi:hypothetical protein
LAHKLDVLRRHCEAEQRPYDQIRKTALDLLEVSRDGANGTVSPSQAIDRLGALSEIGMDEVMLKVPNQRDLSVFDIFGEQIVPAAAKL